MATLYYYRCKNKFSIPKDSDCAMKIGKVPDKYGGQQIFWDTVEVVLNQHHTLKCSVPSLSACPHPP